MINTMMYHFFADQLIIWQFRFSVQNVANLITDYLFGNISPTSTVVHVRNIYVYIPSSLSFLSEQSCSRWISQPGPNHPDSHQHSHSMLWLVLHWPCKLQLPGQPSKVQCFPFQPENQFRSIFKHFSTHLAYDHFVPE
jgi:hypothetical protein